MHPLFHIGDREAFEARFKNMFAVPDSVGVIESPCGRYLIELTTFSEYPSDLARTTFLKKNPGPDYSRGVVREKETGRVIEEIRRNAWDFWTQWIDHPSGDSYLLCAQDIAGYSAINLSSGETRHFCPEGEDLESCLVWRKVALSPDGMRLAVVGSMFFGSPEESRHCVLFDIQSPDSLPYSELARAPCDNSPLESIVAEEDPENGWRDSETFVYLEQCLYRKSDGLSIDQVTEEELDPAQVGTRIERVTLRPGQEPVVEIVSDQ